MFLETLILSQTFGHKTPYEGITSQFGLQQLINELTHHTRNSSYCNDLTFASQPNLVMESGVHSSLLENCHHQIIYAKFNLKIYYAPPYEREITDFLNLKKQRVVLNGKYSSCTSIEAGVPQESRHGPLLFLIHINDLSDELTTNAKLFADDTSLFSIVRDMNTSTANLNNDLNKIKNWTI